MRIKRYIPFIKWAVLALVTAGAGYYLYRNPHLLKALRNVSIAAILGLIVMGQTARLLQALQLIVLSHILDAKITLKEAYGLVICNAMYSYLAPGRAGLGVQAAYLKKSHKLSIAHFASLIAVSNLILFVLASAFGLVVSLAMQAPGVISLAFAFLLGLCIAGTVFVFFSVRLGRYIPWSFLRSACMRMEEGLRLFAGQKGALARVAALRMGQILTTTISLIIALKAVGLHPGLGHVVIIRMMGQMSLLLPLTPGGVGVAEGAMGAAGHALGHPAELVALAVLTGRAVGVLITFAVGGLFTYVLMDLATESPQNDTAVETS